MRLRGWIVVGALLLLSVVAPASAAGVHQVPLKGTMSFSADPSAGTISCTSPVPITHPRVIDMQAIVSHLGKTSAVATSNECSFSLATGLMVGNGQFSFTAANGDQFYGTVSTVMNVVTAEVTFTSEITGGTGRFAGASGSVTGGGMADLVTGTGWFSFSGSMSNIGSTK